ncbi:gliding motility-associated C-terminal domain-containing protein [Olleya sp. YS]|uniref:gliding motility-associated C-terminal domain-containing protein n=1 Tax=Olleya sp. YS TaxID=3028318 RepID=UPI0024344044|nr:gliding motility-associated C-terminal domain-containing protein [Olleya sp. YS]WGD33954.1 gliding motility-associated C-terminal domain-containing protein [Olleya sp. YS]
MKRQCFALLIVAVSFLKVNAQDITLFQQFNGRYDYLAIGNTLNQAENNLSQAFCEILPSSQATLTLPANTTILSAYLFWSGSGSGDTEVTFNSTPITAEDTFTVEYNAGINGLLTYFASYAEVTNQIITEGDGVYTFEDLDISNVLANTPGYCNNRTNYAGWSLYVIYEDDTLPLNQVNLFLGLEIINANIQDKTIILENVNVLDNDNAKIGFLAWEGDNALNFGESLSINGNILSNPPLNLPDNAFNGTNSFTNATDFYNADLDVYDIENNIQIGDTEVVINLTTGATDSNGVFRADLIIINNIITVLNSQLPDATIVLNAYDVACANRVVSLDYTVFNTNSTATLPANTPIAFFIDDVLIAQTITNNDIPIGGSENNQIDITIPNTIPDVFIIEIEVDNDGSNMGIVTETNEVNNETFELIELIPLPETIQLQPITACDEGFNKATFNLTEALDQINQNEYISFTFFESLDAIVTDNSILNPTDYFSNTTPQTLYITAETNVCFDIFVFDLLTENCPPYVPDGFSPNEDSINDFFNIQGLYSVFENHELLIYNRYGTLVFKGDDNTKWYGQINEGLTNQGKTVPVGTYFYVLNLKDSNFKIQTGWVYVNY